MSLFRLALRTRSVLTALPSVSSGTTTTLRASARQLSIPQRHYATKGKTKTTSKLVPGSKQPITDEAALAEYNKADASMKSAVEWYRKECQGLETRASGRVTPALLSPVRVKLHDKEYNLEEVATVGVRDGSILLITLFEDSSMKHVERALYDAKIPGVVPHRQDQRTIKIPIPKPTVEARKEFFATAKRKAEEIRVQVRKQHQLSLKRGKFEKHSIELEEFQKLTDRHIAEVDSILASLQKATSAK